MVLLEVLLVTYKVLWFLLVAEQPSSSKHWIVERVLEEFKNMFISSVKFLQIWRIYSLRRRTEAVLQVQGGTAPN